MKIAWIAVLSLGVMPFAGAQGLQTRGGVSGQSEPGSSSGRTRLYLKDGTYQIVLSYEVKGTLVVYRSAERAGQTEEIPVKLVDLDRTRQWEQRTSPNAAQVPVLDPELQQEEADRVARTPEVAPNLRLKDGESVLVLDVFHGVPNLVPLTQTEGDLNRQTAHNILRQTINPFAHAHQLVQIPGERAEAQMHVDTPEFYVRLDDKDETRIDPEDPGGAMVVDTHGASGVAREASSPKSDYVIVQVDVRRGLRVVTSFDTNLLGSGSMSEDVVETTKTVMPGGHWLKLVPKKPLLFGEYALLEILNEKELNLSVWDFGVHPTAPANRDAMQPAERRRPGLEPR